MVYPEAYIEYLVHFNGTRDYFECHEVLEEHWKEASLGEREQHWVGFIQLAVSMYHHRRGNFPGAKRTLARAIELLDGEKQTITELGLSYEKLLAWMKDHYDMIEASKPYESGLIPITDKKLLRLCQQTCAAFDCRWGAASDLEDTFLIHKHKKRDRTDVIAARQESLQQKSKRKS